MLLKRAKLALLNQLLEIKISTMLVLLRLKETYCSDSKHLRTSFQEKIDQEVEEVDLEEHSEGAEDPEEEHRVEKENPEVVPSTSMPSALKNSPHYERLIVKSTFETNQERLK